MPPNQICKQSWVTNFSLNKHCLIPFARTWPRNVFVPDNCHSAKRQLGYCKEVSLKGKAQYNWPCTNLFRSAPLLLKTLFSFSIKQAILMRSAVLSIPLSSFCFANFVEFWRNDFDPIDFRSKVVVPGLWFCLARIVPSSSCHISDAD
jgi:hypothetical protein